MENIREILLQRLAHLGVDTKLAPGFIRCLANSLMTTPDMSLPQVNRRLQYLGWENFELDYHTLQLAIACIEARGFDSLKTFPLHRLTPEEA